MSRLFADWVWQITHSRSRLPVARHTVLACAALAICAVAAALFRDETGTQAAPPVRPDQAPPADPGLIPLTVPQVRRLLAAATAPSWPPGHIEHWDAWTRRHQARSRWFHERARLARDAEFSLVSARSTAAVTVDKMVDDEQS